MAVKLVSPIKRETQAGGVVVREQGSEENIWTEHGESKRMLKFA